MITCIIVAILITSFIVWVITTHHAIGKKTRIVRVDHAGKSHFIVQHKVLLFFWQGLGTDYHIFEYKTLEEAQKAALEAEEYYMKYKKTIM